MKTARINHLLEKFLSKTASSEEQDELWGYVEDDSNEFIIKHFFEQRLKGVYPNRIPDKTAEAIFAAVLSVTTPATDTGRVVPMKKHHTWRWVAAALVFLIAAGAGVFIVKQRSQPPVANTRNIVIMPGSGKAILTLGDGASIALDKTGNDTLHQGNTLVKNGSGGLLYEKDAAKRSAVVYNRLTTPRGGQYQVQLADGTKVWLNAASSLYYPTSFNEKTRTVEVSGEAYFEVAPNIKQPFSVKVSGKQTIAVLGTSFNVNSYEDEKEINTTLITGAVKIDAAGQATFLKPGQQLQQDITRGTTTVVPQVDIRHVTAWKNGAFSFNGVNLANVMRQLSRWYNVDVSFEGEDIPPGTFKGEIGMDLTLQEVLDGLAGSKIRYKIVNKEKIIIYR